MYSRRRYLIFHSQLQEHAHDACRKYFMLFVGHAVSFDGECSMAGLVVELGKLEPEQAVTAGLLPNPLHDQDRDL